MPDRPAEVVLEALELARAGRFAAIRDLFAPKLQPLVVPEALAQAWAAELQQQGEITAVGTPLSEPAPPAGVTVKVPVTCTQGGFTIVGTVADDGRLLGLQLAPLDAAEADRALGAARLRRPGQLRGAGGHARNRPALGARNAHRAPRAGPHPARLSCSPAPGSLDRDETIGRNKPLKDIAWGLASRGITVAALRQGHLRPRERAEGRARTSPSTDEYLPQAIAAIHLLQQHPAVDPGRALPARPQPRRHRRPTDSSRRAVGRRTDHPRRRSPAAPLGDRPTDPLPRLARPRDRTAAQPAIEALAEKAQRVDSPDLSPDTPANELPLGAPAAYWLDLRDYNPARSPPLGKPMLILQGGRDYQATVDDDLALWQDSARRPRPT